MYSSIRLTYIPHVNTHVITYVTDTVGTTTYYNYRSYYRRLIACVRSVANQSKIVNPVSADPTGPHNS